MAFAAVGYKLYGKPLRELHNRCLSLFHTETPLQLSIRTAVETKDYSQIPHLLQSYDSTDPNPFSFLSSLPPTLTVKLVDGILQSSISIRPRSLAYPMYSSLISFTLPVPSHNPDVPTSFLPLSLAVLQTSIRSGFPTPPSTQSALAALWVHLRRRHHRLPVSRILSSVRDIGYRLDLNTCNYLIVALCSASEIEEAIRVLQGVCGAGCIPDSESYCTVIEAACGDGRVMEAEELLRDMVLRQGIMPKKGMAWRMVAAMRKKGEARRVVDVIKFLEREGCMVGFEGYEEAVEGCLEKREFVLAGKVVVEMSKRGFIPYVNVRHRVVQGLANIGQHELAGSVRQSLADIGS